MPSRRITCLLICLLVLAGAKVGDARSAPPPQLPLKKGPARTDLFDDPLPPGAVARLGTLRERHQHQVYSVAFLAGGKIVASASHDATIRLWDTATGKELRQWAGHKDFVIRVASSPDGKLLASTGGDDRVRIWNLEGKEVRQLQSAGRRQPLSVAFSPDGKFLAVGGGYEDHGVSLWELDTGKELWRFWGHSGYVKAVAFSPDGKRIASVCENGGVVVRDTDGSRLFNQDFKPEGYLRALEDVIFTPDGKSLVLAGNDYALHVWDAATGKEQRRITGHKGAVYGLALSPDGKTLVSGSLDLTLRLWDLATGKELRRCEGHLDCIYDLAWSSDGKTLVSGGYDWTVRLWDAATGKQLRQCGNGQSWVAAAAFALDGKTLATGGYDRLIHLWESPTGKELRRLEGHEGYVATVAFSPDGKTLASGSDDKTVRLWDVATGKEHRRMEGPGRAVMALAFSMDGKTLACVAQESMLVGAGPPTPGQVFLWDTTTGKELRRWELKRAAAFVAFSPDARLLAVTNGPTSILDVASGRELCRAQAPNSHVRALAFSADGRTLAGSNDNHHLLLWESSTGQIRGDLLGTDSAMTLAFSPDGRTVISSGYWNRGLSVWDTVGGKQLGKTDPHQHAVLCLAFSPDGKALASGSRDTTGLVWDIPNLVPAYPSPETKPNAARLDALWIELVGKDPVKAYQARWELAQFPAEAVPFVAARLSDLPLPDGRRLAQLVADLDHDQFGMREKAMHELERLADLAEPALRQALAGKSSPELRRRIEVLLEKLPGRPPCAEKVHAGRALEVLELTAALEAQRTLTELAKGRPESWLTQEARATLERFPQSSRRNK